jgi:hypothetical protein
MLYNIDLVLLTNCVGKFCKPLSNGLCNKQLTFGGVSKAKKLNTKNTKYSLQNPITHTKHYKVRILLVFSLFAPFPSQNPIFAKSKVIL